MLKQRVLTAIVLALIVFGAIWGLSPLLFQFFLGVVAAFAIWEWSDISGLSKPSYRIAYTVIFLMFLMGGLQISEAFIKPIFILSIIWWCFTFICICLFPKFSSLWKNKIIVSLSGLFVLYPCWLALSYLRSSPNFSLYLLLLLGVVAAADIGAYFTGRTFGKRKLAPNVSPGKTWEGVVGGALSCTLLLMCVVMITQSKSLSISHYLLIFLCALALTSFSVIGDLFESLLKRSRGIKDSGNILPGHGGILDRIDGILATAPLFALLIIQLQGFLQ